MIVCNKVFRGANEAVSPPAHFYGRITSSVVGREEARNEAGEDFEGICI